MRLVFKIYIEGAKMSDEGAFTCDTVNAEIKTSSSEKELNTWMKHYERYLKAFKEFIEG